MALGLSLTENRHKYMTTYLTDQNVASPSFTIQNGTSARRKWRHRVPVRRLIQVYGYR
jgi:hypothetical protein